MKLKYFVLAMACVMALALTGCSANNDVNSTAPVTNTDSGSGGQNDRPSADIGGAQNSADVGGGAQNSSDVDDDAQNSAGVGGKARSGAGSVIDDIGDAVGDTARGAGNAIGNMGDAIGDAANGAGRAMP